MGALPGDAAKPADPLRRGARHDTLAVRVLQRTTFSSPAGFRPTRSKDIGSAGTTGLVELVTLNYFLLGTSCKVTTLYDQTGNGDDMWRGDDPNMNQPGTLNPAP